jgi:phenylalanyl-tRNA synthetase beta chain
VNVRRLCAVMYNKTPCFEQVHGLLDRIFEVLQVKGGCRLRATDGIPTFFPGRGAQVVVGGDDAGGGVVVGHIGVLHPEVCAAFELTNPASALEIDIQQFL